MLEFLYGVGAGVVGASIGWFFVWRNNKAFMKAQIEKLEAKVNEVIDK